MSNIKVGIQTHAVREDFAEDPAKTLKRIADIGYQGIETTWGALKDAKVPLQASTTTARTTQQQSTEARQYLIFLWKTQAMTT